MKQYALVIFSICQFDTCQCQFNVSVYFEYFIKLKTKTNVILYSIDLFFGHTITIHIVIHIVRSYKNRFFFKYKRFDGRRFSNRRAFHESNDTRLKYASRAASIVCWSLKLACTRAKLTFFFTEYYDYDGM